jgi:hypothetical protein
LPQAGQETDHWNKWLLRTRRKRPSCRAAEKANELTSPHIRSKLRGSIVSAQTSTLIGGKIGIKTIAAVHSQYR